MTRPRRVVPGATYLVTRRCYQRTFRLRPSPATTHILAYCLALALDKTGVELHAACFMSNHHHLVITDPRGELPNFLRELHRSTAKAINASQGHWENLWSAEPCSAIRLADEEDFIDKVAYVAVNPVTAGLVAQPQDWPGLSGWTPGVARVRRPEMYFDENGVCPEELSLRFVAPVASERPTWRRRLEVAIATKVAKAHNAMRAEGRAFLGRAGVLARSFTERAMSREPRRVLVPTVAARNPGARKALLLIQRAFRVGYRMALDAWKAGDRRVAFPFGTWWMRVHHAALSEPDAGTG